MSCASQPSGDILKAVCRLGITDPETTDEQNFALPSHGLAQGRNTYFGQALIHFHLLSHTPKWVVRLLPLWLTLGCEPNQITPWLLGVTGSLASLRYFHHLACVTDQLLSNCHTHCVFVRTLLVVELVTLKNVVLKWYNIHKEYSFIKQSYKYSNFYSQYLTFIIYLDSFGACKKTNKQNL